MFRKKHQCEAQQDTVTAPAIFGIDSAASLPSVAYLSLTLLIWAIENSN